MGFGTHKSSVGPEDRTRLIRDHGLPLRSGGCVTFPSALLINYMYRVCMSRPSALPMEAIPTSTHDSRSNTGGPGGGVLSSGDQPGRPPYRRVITSIYLPASGFQMGYIRISQDYF